MDVRSLGRLRLERSYGGPVQSAVLCHAVGSGCFCVSIVLTATMNRTLMSDTLCCSSALLGPFSKSLGLSHSRWAGIFDIDRDADKQVKRIGTDRLREAFAEVPEARQVGESPSNSSARDARRKGDLVGEKIVEK